MKPIKYVGHNNSPVTYGWLCWACEELHEMGGSASVRQAQVKAHLKTTRHTYNVRTWLKNLQRDPDTLPHDSYLRKMWKEMKDGANVVG